MIHLAEDALSVSCVVLISTALQDAWGTRVNAAKILRRQQTSTVFKLVRALCLCLLLRREPLHHRFTHQVRREQTLRQNVVMKSFLIESGPQSRFRLFSQCDQFCVSVEITVSLAGAPVRESLHFFLRKGVGGIPNTNPSSLRSWN